METNAQAECPEPELICTKCNKEVDGCDGIFNDGDECGVSFEDGDEMFMTQTVIILSGFGSVLKN